MSRPFSRRDALKAAGAAVALPYLVPSHVWAAAPNDTVRVGIIGLGGRSRSIVSESKGIKDLKIAAVCDCFRPRIDEFVKSMGEGQGWATYEDFRQMIDKEKLDGVMVETTTHARAWIVMLAMQAGMDTYIEKPMCLTIAEGRLMVKAARKFDRVTQVGTQQRSMPINTWASDLVKNGTLGKCLHVLAPNFVGAERWTNEGERPLPKGGSDKWWDIWTNQAELRPYHPQLHHGWERWWDYDGGGRCFGVTGWGTHSYDQINRALGTDDTGPTEIVLEEPVQVLNTGKYTAEQVPEDDTGLAYHGLSKPVIGPRAKVRMKFANGTELRLHLDGDRGPGLGAIFTCEKGKIEINRNKLSANPKEILLAADNPGPIDRPETQYHVQNWVDCVKSRSRCNADIEIGLRATSLCYLVNIVRDIGKVGETLRWDPAAERFTNCDDANAYLSRPRRKGYELPDVG
jgi:predicted dehydrogenase